jgi:hypothetical protein
MEDQNKETEKEKCVRQVTPSSALIFSPKRSNLSKYKDKAEFEFEMRQSAETAKRMRTKVKGGKYGNMLSIHANSSFLWNLETFQWKPDEQKNLAR